ncbi:hypothetical protein Nepgr_012616 [Nepenthes gracilis]|uniref:Uncharacterized protein n=1 Tax=Nepenthes gracilis TaxID=150966 RepID=A0AAD3SG31_NEPGR|nr:hypothetical protein Nepgr_012616 [Nepenthes gracilis]
MEAKAMSVWLPPHSILAFRSRIETFIRPKCTLTFPASCKHLPQSYIPSYHVLPRGHTALISSDENSARCRVNEP